MRTLRKVMAPPIALMLLSAPSYALGQEGKGAPTTSARDSAKYPASMRALLLSKQEKIVAMSIVVGRDSKRTPQQIGQYFLTLFKDAGVPIKIEMDVMDGAGAEYAFYIDGNGHLTTMSDGMLGSRYDTRGALEQFPAVVRAFSKKYPEALKPLPKATPAR